VANTQQRQLDLSLVPKDAEWARRLFADLNATLQANQRNVAAQVTFLDFTFRTDSGGVPTTPLRDRAKNIFDPTRWRLEPPAF
jgi:hypothetical protein